MLPRVGASSSIAASSGLSYAPIIGNNDGMSSLNSSRRRTTTGTISAIAPDNGSTNGGNGSTASLSALSSGRNQFGFAALPRLVFLPETPDEPLIRIAPRRRRRRKVATQLPFSPPSYMNQQSNTKKKKRSKKKRDSNIPVIGPLSAGDEDKMVTSMINTARADAEVTLAAAKRALDISGQHRVAQLRLRCECAAHLATAKSILRLLTSPGVDGSRSPVAHLPRIALRLIVSYLPLHQIQAQVAVDGRHFVYNSNGAPLRSNTSWPTTSLSSDHQSVTYVTISLSLRRDSSFELVYREETAAIDQVSDRLVDNAQSWRTLQMEERITGDWYRERDMITLVYMRSAFFKAKPATIIPVNNNMITTDNNATLTVINASSPLLSSPPILSPLVITSSMRAGVKSMTSSQSARARRLHQGGTAADGPLQVASFRVPKPPHTARNGGTSSNMHTNGLASLSSSTALASTSSRRSTLSNIINHGGGNNGSAREHGARIRLDRSGRPMQSRPIATNSEPTLNDTSPIPAITPVVAPPASIPMITSRATHEIVDGGEWQYHIMDVYVFHELALGVNARGMAALHNHAGPFRLLPSATVPSSAAAISSSSSLANTSSSYITISAADHGGVAALASSLLNGSSSSSSSSSGGNGNGNDAINWDTQNRRVRFVNRRPLHDIPFVLTATDTSAPLISDS